MGNALAMLADNIEHVISYWVLGNKFHSAALGGFAVISHWVPFLLFSGYAGALADRLDPRRMIQAGMGLFMFVSACWSVLFITGALQIWEAWILLTLHGFAGVLWTTPAQLMIHDIVEPSQLQSAVRLNATSRYLGLLMGPALGSGLLLVFGSSGIVFNILFYAPLLLWLWKAPYGPRFRAAAHAVPRAVARGLADAVATVRAVADNRLILVMIMLTGGASFFVGSAYGPQMPQFARDLGHGDPGLSYAALLCADAAGALVAAIVLESRGLLAARGGTALFLGALWCLAIGGFALTHDYALCLTLLFMAGFMELTFNSMSQTLVQLGAPVEMRGRIIGVFVTAAMGLRAFSGIFVGLLGDWVGVHYSLALSAGALLLWILWLATQWRTTVAQAASEERGRAN